MVLRLAGKWVAWKAENLDPQMAALWAVLRAESSAGHWDVSKVVRRAGSRAVLLGHNWAGHSADMRAENSVVQRAGHWAERKAD